MKKIFLLLMVVVGLFSLAGCNGYTTGEKVENGDFKAVGDIGDYDLLRDVHTGCTYLEAHDDINLTPYYGEDGKVVGCGQDNIEKYK